MTTPLSLARRLIVALPVATALAAPVRRAELSKPADHLRGAVRARRLVRRAGAPAGGGNAAADRSAGRGREQAGRLRRHRRELCLAGGAGRLHAARQRARRRAEPALPPGALRSGQGFLADRHGHRRAAAGADRQCRRAVQDGGRIDRLRQGQSGELRHLRSGDLAGDRGDAAQRPRQDQHRRGALSRLGAGRRRRRDGRGAGLVRVLRQCADPVGRRTRARAGGDEPEAAGELAGDPDHGGARLSWISTTPGLSASPRRPRRRRRSSPSSTSTSTRRSGRKASRSASRRSA